MVRILVRPDGSGPAAVCGGLAVLLVGLSACTTASDPGVAASEFQIRMSEPALDPSADTSGLRRDLEAQRHRLDRQEQRLDAQARQIEEQRRVIAWLRVRRSEDAASTFSPPGDGSAKLAPPPLILAQDEGPVAPRAPDESVAPRDEPPAATGNGEGGRPEAERPTDQLLVDRGGVLLPEGTFQLEPGLEYAHTSSDRVSISGFSIFDAIVIGTIRVDDLERDILTASVTGRYGVTDRLQAELRVPYVYRQDEEILGVGTNDQRIRNVSGQDLGDVSASLGYQALDQDGWIPATVVRGSVSAPTGRDPFEIDRETIGPGGDTRLTEVPTGSGFWGVGPEATFVWRADPAVFFAGGGYTFNLKDDQGEFGEIDPGDTIEWFVGTNFALSELVSLNLSFVNQLTDETEQNGQVVPGSSTNDARFVLGTSLGLSPSTSLLTSAGIGLTDESPDFTFTVSIPITFDLF